MGRTARKTAPNFHRPRSRGVKTYPFGGCADAFRRLSCHLVWPECGAIREGKHPVHSWGKAPRHGFASIARSCPRFRRPARQRFLTSAGAGSGDTRSKGRETPEDGESFVLVLPVHFWKIRRIRETDRPLSVDADPYELDFSPFRLNDETETVLLDLDHPRGQFGARWIYYVLPLEGALMALIVCLLLAAGIFQPADNNNGQDSSTLVYSYGLAGFSGLFAKNALRKLGELADALFGKPSRTDASGAS